MCTKMDWLALQLMPSKLKMADKDCRWVLGARLSPVGFDGLFLASRASFDTLNLAANLLPQARSITLLTSPVTHDMNESK